MRVLGTFRFLVIFGLLALVLGGHARGVGRVPDSQTVIADVERHLEKENEWKVPHLGKETAKEFSVRLLAEAKKGDAKAQATLGWCYQFGFGVKRDLKAAVRWYLPAAEQGHAGAQYSLGMAYDGGQGVTKDAVKALEWYRKAAAQGQTQAMFEIAFDYAKGIAVPQDWAEANSWYQQAAEGGSLMAMNNLGNIFLLGHGVPVNLAEARRWLTPPAEKGIAVAQFGLACSFKNEGNVEAFFKWVRRSAEGGFPGGEFYYGKCFDDGYGVERNPSAAAIWYRRSALHGFAMGAVQFADCLINGVGVQHDVAAGVRLLITAAESGEPKAQGYLARLYVEGDIIPKQPKKGCELARKAAEQGEAMGQFMLGICYYRGTGVGIDFEQAAHWYLKAAEQGHPDAAFDLGLLLEAGQGVLRDYQAAVKWYLIAAKAGHATAQYRLGLDYRDGLGVNADEKEAVKWLRLSLERKENKEVRAVLAELERQTKSAPLQTEAIFRDAMRLMQGPESERDPAKAVVLLRQAAEAGHPMAQDGLAWDLWLKSADEKNREEALAWTKKAATMNAGRSQVILADFMRRGFLVPKDEAAGDALMEKGLAHVEPRMVTHIAWMFFKGDVVAEDRARAVTIFQMASELGEPSAQNAYGYALMTAATVPADPTEAWKWWLLAAERGNHDAEVNMQNYLGKMSDEQREEAGRRAKNFTPKPPGHR